LRCVLTGAPVVRLGRTMTFCVDIDFWAVGLPGQFHGKVLFLCRYSIYITWCFSALQTCTLYTPYFFSLFFPVLRASFQGRIEARIEEFLFLNFTEFKAEICITRFWLFLDTGYYFDPRLTCNLLSSCICFWVWDYRCVPPYLVSVLDLYREAVFLFHWQNTHFLVSLAHIYACGLCDL
jgi:hypothetical protein